MIKKSVTIRINEKKDARPIALLVQEANQYASEVYLEIDNKKINAKSIMGMMSIRLCSGEELNVLANGKDEKEAVNGIGSFLEGAKK